jgi:hypothetical protein
MSYTGSIIGIKTLCENHGTAIMQQQAQGYAVALCAYVLVALLHRSHGATVDLESKGAGVSRGL